VFHVGANYIERITRYSHQMDGKECCG